MVNQVFVTVGTTKFDALIDTILDERILKDAFVENLSCVELIIQSGRYRLDNLGYLVENSTTQPIIPNSKSFLFLPNPQLKITSIEMVLHLVFEYASSVKTIISTSDVIITHCGAGTLLECLRLSKRVIAVVNSDLMNNHQQEVQIALSTDNKYIIPAPIKYSPLFIK